MKHIRYDEETDHASPDIDLVKLRYTTISSRYCDILKRYVEVILGCHFKPQCETLSVHIQNISRVVNAGKEVAHGPSASFPRYSWPVLSSTVMICPSDSCKSFTGTPRPDVVIFAGYCEDEGGGWRARCTRCLATCWLQADERRWRMVD